MHRLAGGETLSKSAVFGIVGGYGATGRVVISELLKSCEGQLLVGGRDLARLNSVASGFGGRVSAVRVDAMDVESLNEFCNRCSVVVNCSGPVMMLQDRVAQAARRARSHYVDLAGLSVVKERLLPYSREITDLGLSFVISAGWMPGLTELLPCYGFTRAKSEMDAVDSLNVYFSDSGEWSINALRDGLWYLRRVGLPAPRYFRKGTPVRARMSQVYSNVDVGEPIGLRRYTLYASPELNEVGRRLTDCDVFSYTYLSGPRNALMATMIALLPLPEKLGLRFFRNIFRRNRLPVGGFVAAHVLGQSQGRRAVLRIRVDFDAGQDYWMNGVVSATVSGMIAS